MEKGDRSKCCFDWWSENWYLVNVESEYKVEMGLERTVCDKIVQNMDVNDNLKEEICTQ